MRTFIALTVACVTVVMGICVVTPTAQAAGHTACSESLNLARQKTYRFKNGGEVLPFGRVTVTPTKQYRHRYCEEIDIGDQFPRYKYRRTDSVRRGSTCTNNVFRLAVEGAPFGSPSYRQGVRVRDRACMFQTFSVKWQGKWWTTKVKRYNP